MEKFKGKKVLFLGSNAGTIDLVRYAQRNGAYVLVADYYDDGQSPAKQIADESILVSTADLDKLEAIVRNKKIDCIYCGISEFNLIQAMRLSERCKKPFYCSEEQWSEIAEKQKFRALCERYSVPCPRTYYVGEAAPVRLPAEAEYPVVVKPVDGSGSAGVSICQDEAALRIGIESAFSNSTIGKIIIEQFVTGYEFTAHYTIYDGRATLSCIDNRYPTAVHEGSVTTIPAARVYPSLFTDEFIETVNESMIKLCEGLGVKFGVLFVQGLFNPDTSQFAIFEAGLRSAAECPFKLIRDVNGVDYSTMILDSMLLDSMPEIDWKDDPHLNGRSCGVVSYIAKHGVVGEIKGLEETVGSLTSVTDYELRYPVGSETPDGDTLHQLLLRFFMVCDSREQMARDVDFINCNVDVLDSNGRSLALKFDPNRLFALV